MLSPYNVYLPFDGLLISRKKERELTNSTKKSRRLFNITVMWFVGKLHGSKFFSVPRCVEAYRSLVTPWSPPPTTPNPRKTRKVVLSRPSKMRGGEALTLLTDNRLEGFARSSCAASAVDIPQPSFSLWEMGIKTSHPSQGCCED